MPSSPRSRLATHDESAPAGFRQARQDDWPELLRLYRYVFGTAFPAERFFAQKLFEPDRALVMEVPAGASGRQLAAALSVYSLTLTVPGGVAVPVAGVTAVGVLPTYRRRGIFTEALRRHLTDLHMGAPSTAAERAARGGEPLSVLFATESAAYQRFGYGCATRSLHMTVARNAALRADGPTDPELYLELASATELRDPAEELYRQVAARRTGMIARSGVLHDHVIGAAEREQESSCVIAKDGSGQPRAFARFDTDPTGRQSGAAATLRVREVLTSDPAAASLLWRFLLDQDLSCAVRVPNLPVDDPLLHLLLDVRTPRPRLADGLYLRVVDVDRALAARRYRTPVDLVIAVTDPVCPWNNGHWRLIGGTDGALCHRTTAPAQLALTALDLGTLYLGGTTPSELAQAGRLQERSPGAVRTADLAFCSSLAPWSAFAF